jgi:hypothetical protein
MGKNGILESLIDKFNLHEEFCEVYTNRYEVSLSFIEKVLEEKEAGLADEFNVSYLAINEIFSALRDELRCILLFNKGMPVSRWRDPRINPDIKQEDYEFIYEKTMKSFDTLFANKYIMPVAELSPEIEKEYFEIFSSILFLVRNARTQDATLLTTSILYLGKYFVTLDEPLIRAAKKTLSENYGLQLLKPKQALDILKRKKKKD